MIYELYIFITLVCTCILFHELGHLVCLRVLKKPAVLIYKLGGDLEINCKDLKVQEFRMVIMSGVLFGLVPLVCSFILNTSGWKIFFNFAALIIVLLMGSSYDLKEVYDSFK